MKARMLHRGPDAGGTYFSEDGQVTLGHRRLSIVDLSENGAQPMTSHSGRYVITYNEMCIRDREYTAGIERKWLSGTDRWLWRTALPLAGTDLLSHFIPAF